ncbi:glycosyltransferase family protein [Caenispirillum bisanense]|uniref:Spore maturation protein CgeB n=1 Tax=Caenispirillum bisanense TaxID=414052 RepID=A0A286GSE2_9PROT|nr:glycosyltransferase [Caenispirillum bisanense]SOD97989.1 Spore maturation protein CgeB [Caenispirillum bisanense]
MHIAFFGSSIVSAYWNGAATYYRGILGALARRGHRITFYEPDAFDRQKHRDIEPPEWCRVVVYKPCEDAAAAQLEDARGADLVVKASGVGVLDSFLEKSVLALKSPRTRVVFWDVDAPATLESIHTSPDDRLGPLVPDFDMILTYGGGPPVVSAYEALGAKACVPIYNALEPETHHPVPPDPAFAADLSFLGNRLPDRERRVEEFFLKAAAGVPGKRFLMGGSGWDDKPMPDNVRWIGHVYTHQHNAFNCSARAVLNITRDSMARTGFSPPTRVFEACGAGSCLVTDAWTGIEQFLEPDREVLTAVDGDAVAAHLADLSPERAAAIGAAGRARVLAHHTYDHRALEVERLLEGRDTGAPALEGAAR